MFWTAMLMSALAIVFVKLGALSVMVTVLSMSLKLMLLIFAAVGIVFLWQRIKPKTDKRFLGS
jgi:hypothetical protein